MTEKKEVKSLKEQYMESQKNAFFREVAEEVKAEKISIIWNTYKNYIIGVIVVILGITICNNWYENYKKETSLKEAKKFERILSAKNTSVDGKILELKEFANTAKFGYRDVAYFNIYSMQIENQKIEDAIQTLQTIIDNSTDNTFKNLAIVKLGNLISSIPENKIENVKTMLSGIGKKQPFYATAQFVLGTIYIRENNLASAQKIFEEITDNESLPISLKSESLNILNFVKASEAKAK